MTDASGWDFQHLLWLVPVLFAVHNAEEAPQMERWMHRLPPGLYRRVTTRQFALAVCLLTVLVAALTAIAASFPDSAVATHMVLGAQAAIFVNVLLPHVLATLRYRLYSPGLVSGLLLNVPFSLVLFGRALEERRVTWLGLLLLHAVAPVVIFGLARASLRVSALLVGGARPGR